VRLAVVCEQLPPADFAECVCDLAHLNAPALEQWTTIADAAVDDVHQWYNATHIIRLLHGYSRLSVMHRPLFNVFATRLQVRPILASLKPHEVCVAMHAFADVKYLDERLFQALGRQAEREAEEYGALEVALTVHAQSQLYLLNPVLYHAMANRALEVTEQFADPTVALLFLEGLGDSNISRKDCVSAVLDVLDLDTLGPHGTVSVLIACCNNYYSGPQLPTMTEYLTAHIDELTNEELIDCAEVLQTMGWRESKFLVAMTERCLRLHQMGDFTPVQCRVLMDVLASFTINHPECRVQLSAAAKSVILPTTMVDPLEAAAEQQALTS